MTLFVVCRELELATAGNGGAGGVCLVSSCLTGSIFNSSKIVSMRISRDQSYSLAGCARRSSAEDHGFASVSVP